MPSAAWQIRVQGTLVRQIVQYHQPWFGCLIQPSQYFPHHFFIPDTVDNNTGILRKSSDIGSQHC